MRKYFFVAFLLACFICNGSYAQDLIVTNVGDSLACKIILQTKESVHYSYSKYNHNTVRILAMDRIKSTIPGFYMRTDSFVVSTDSLDADGVAVINLRVSDDDINGIKEAVFLTNKTAVSKWSFGINGGYAYRLFRPRIKSTPYELKYINELKSGYSFGADAFYFPWEKVGFGLKYDIYKSKGERDIRTKNDISIQFIGGSVGHRMLFENRKTSVVTAFWVGYQPYRNVTKFVGQDYLLKANTMGWGVSIGLDHPISKKLAVSVGASCFTGSIYKFRKEMKGNTEMIKLSKDRFEDLSRAAFTVGLKFLQ